MLWVDFNVSQGKASVQIQPGRLDQRGLQSDHSEDDDITVYLQQANFNNTFNIIKFFVTIYHDQNWIVTSYIS